MADNEHTSAKLASLAAAVLADPNSSDVMKSLAASVLTQAPDHEEPEAADDQK